uniref:Uncharacterized protein n=1 Tax=Rhinopithecus bieti TaxID=61621 RepID=A0A2K6KXE9_RHIBE
MLWLLRLAWAFFWRMVDPAERQGPQQQGLPQGIPLCALSIDSSLLSSSTVVTARLLQKVDTKVNVLGESMPKTYKHLFGLRDLQCICLNMCKMDFSSSRTDFKVVHYQITCEIKHFVPYKGDLLEVEYTTEPGISNIKASSVKPTRCIHVEEVRITSVHGRNGMIDYTIFFTLESVKIPDGYIPQVDDIVNVVMVENIQFCCNWRAVSITPVQKL